MKLDIINCSAYSFDRADGQTSKEVASLMNPTQIVKPNEDVNCLIFKQYNKATDGRYGKLNRSKHSKHQSIPKLQKFERVLIERTDTETGFCHTKLLHNLRLTYPIIYQPLDHQFSPTYSVRYIQNPRNSWKRSSRVQMAIWRQVND